MDVLVGTRVVRGPNWTWGEQDGGEGHVGTVAEVLKADRSGEVVGGCSGPCVVTVQWDCGNRCRYRCGVGDRYDLRVLDSAPAGINHHRIVCNICGLPLNGMRWKCVKCCDYDLCTFCYMSGKHELDHTFDRMDTPRFRVRVPTRVSSKKKEARGIFEHAKVVPGRDWLTPSDAQVESDVFICGEVVSTVVTSADSLYGFAEVKWDDSRYSSIHKVGFEGKVELMCVEPSCVSYYYPDHLPDLGAPVEEVEMIQSHDISPGDYVRVELDPEVFRAMHAGNEETGWDDLMMQVLGLTGQVQRVFDSGNLRIKFSRSHIWTICADAVVKADIPRFSVGDTVSVTTDEHELSKHKDIREFSSMFYGERCRVYETYSNGIVTIMSKQKLWSFLPSLLVAEDDLSSLPWSNPLPNADNLQILKHYLTQHPNEVNRKLAGRTAMHCAAVTGNSRLLKMLLDFGANIDIQDSKRYRALHYSVLSGSIEATEVLINAGADVNVSGYNGNTPLILAADRGHTGIAKLLLKHPDIKVNAVDLDGNTALLVAVLTQHLQIISLLLDAGADPSLVNFRLGNAFIEAARIGLTAAVKRMIEHNPENAKISNEYGYNLLHTGALYGRKDIVSLAIEKCGIDVDSREEVGQTALHVALQESHIPVIEQLVKYGADINAKDESQLTPLHIIIMCRDYFDIPSDASPEIKKFHEALMGKLSDNVNKLYSPVSLLIYFLKKGADMHIQGPGGQSPLSMLPYLAKLMTTLVENEDLLSEESTFSSKEGIFAMSGGDRPYMLSKDAKDLNDYRELPGRRKREDYASSYSRRDYGEDRQLSALDGRSVSSSHPSFPYRQSGDKYSDGLQSNHSVSYSDNFKSSTHNYAKKDDSSSYLQQRRMHQYSNEYYNGQIPQTKNDRSLHSGFKEQPDSEQTNNITCFLCDLPANVRFHPCGHSVMCSQCAARAKKCPTCRGQVKGFKIN